MKNIYVVFLVCGLLFFGLGAGYFIGINYQKKVLTDTLDIIRPIRENNSSYLFINPLLAYIIPSAEQQSRFTVLKKEISSLISAEKIKGELSDASVFFSDLNQGRWIGVGENQKYAPASMLKVVIAVAYFKMSEKDQSILKKELLYTKAQDQLLKDDIFNSTSSLIVGNKYSVEDLIHKMLTESDNGAEFLLLDAIDVNYLNSIYEVLNIENPEYLTGEFTISPRSYSLFFRILYSATYLRKSNSEKVLEILSKTTFRDGIVAGVPSDVIVAHKFGEYVSAKNNQIKSIELHDCGIVYDANNPYFLCIMTRGSNLDVLKNTIKSIASLVYRGYK